MLLGIILGLIGLVLGIVAINKAATLEGRLRKTRELADNLQTEVKELRKLVLAQKPAAADAVQPSSAPVSDPVTETEKAAAPAESSVPLPAAEPPQQAEPKAAPIAAPEPVIRSARGGLEQALAGRWFVVIGGIAVALGGLLLVKYAHDNGLIPPGLRVILGYVFAAGLVAAGEYVRQHRPAGIADYVPAALSAAGLVIAFGVTYAAYALYDLIPSGLCFPLLVMIGLAALWLSRRQGPLIAALGLIGSYAAPALVPSEHPSAFGFFAYLIVIVCACLFELRSRPWWWLGFAAIGGATVWAFLWLLGGLFEPAHLIPAALFAFILAASSAFIPRGISLLREDVGTLAEPRSVTPPLRIAVAGTAAGALTLGALVTATHYGTMALTLFALGMVLVAGFGWLKPQRNIAAGLAALLTLIVFMAWPRVSTLVPAFDERGFWALVPELIEPKRFVSWMLAAALLFTGLGLAGIWRRSEVRYWDVLTAGAGVLFVFGAWARADFALTAAIWAIAGIGLAAAVLLAAWHVRLGEARADTEITQGMLLGATALLTLFAADRLFDGVIYTLVIAALAAACAVISGSFTSRAPGMIAIACASLASLRLFVGREFWGDPQGLVFGAHWPLYGYGVPAALFWWASRRLMRPRDEKAMISFEGLSLGLLIALVSLELRVLIGGGITAQNMSVLELGSHVTAWLGAAYGLAWRQKLYSGLVARLGTYGLTGISVLVLISLLTARNPAFTGDTLHGSTLINGLWLAYLLPAVLLALIFNREHWMSMPPQRTVLAGFAMVLVMCFVTLMVKRWHQGPRLVPEFVSDAESYMVSLTWLMTGLFAFMAGMRIDRQSVRLGGLIVLVLTVLKVFILDLAGLTGLWRIASLMGLGFCLIGIGWLYTRFAARTPKLRQPI